MLYYIKTKNWPNLVLFLGFEMVLFIFHLLPFLLTWQHSFRPQYHLS